MNESVPVLDEAAHERTVFVEACESGWNPQSVVRQLVWHDGRVHEEILVFPTLREALDYAQRACASADGPTPPPTSE